MASLWSLFSSHEVDEDKNVLHRQVTPSLSPPPPAKRARLSGEEIQLGGLVNNPLLLAPVNTFHHPPISIDRDVDKIVKGIRLENRKRSNAVHAKRSRERNKQFVASLELESQALQKENDCLKALVKKNLPDRAQSIIGECCYKPRGKGFPQGTQATSRLAHIIGSDFDLLESLTSGGHSFVLTDPRLPDNPIVYASSAFFKMTGYTRDTVVGRNCRFLQGIDTKTEAVNTIREAIKSGTDGAACLLNYKADGTPFWNSFFIAALRDRDHRIVNYVGVQSEVDKSTSKDTSLDFMNSNSALPSQVQKFEKVIPVFSANLKPGAKDPENITICPIKADHTVSLADAHTSIDIAEGEQEDDDIDWADLAEVLEADYQDGCEGGESTPNWMYEDMDSLFLKQEEPDSDPTDENCLRQFFQSPRALVTKTVRSELIDSLLKSRGDVTNPRFLSALNVLSNIFGSSNRVNYSISSVLNGSWRSISKPTYGGCLGVDQRSDLVYTLRKLSFNIFKPGNVRCTVQQTMNYIQPVCVMDKAPSAAPFSLRREMALSDSGSSIIGPNTMLKSYDIAVALTIEPGRLHAKEDEEIPSPPRRLRGLQIMRGYFLPDPERPNRLTVWFTGGTLSPAPAPEGESGTSDESYGGVDEWIALFGADHKKTWGESISNLGAKLFLGAELPHGMDSDGSMSYSLHRPYGGHGKAYVDVLYVDDELLITRGNSGTIHAMTQNRTLPSPDPVPFVNETAKHDMDADMES